MIWIDSPPPPTKNKEDKLELTKFIERKIFTIFLIKNLKKTVKLTAEYKFIKDHGAYVR